LEPDELFPNFLKYLSSLLILANSLFKAILYLVIVRIAAIIG